METPLQNFITFLDSERQNNQELSENLYLRLRQKALELSKQEIENNYIRSLNSLIMNDLSSQIESVYNSRLQTN